MECNHWLEKGLLFTSGELDEKEMEQFNIHLTTCSICKSELELYTHERENYFNLSILEETPSSVVDDEILRVCSKLPIPTSTHIGYISFFKKAFLALLVLVIGFSGGAYFTGLKTKSEIKNAENTIPKEKKLANHPTNNNKSNVLTTAGAGEGTISSDSLSPDSLQKTINRGNGNMDGILPVITTQQK